MTASTERWAKDFLESAYRVLDLRLLVLAGLSSPLSAPDFPYPPKMAVTIVRRRFIPKYGSAMRNDDAACPEVVDHLPNLAMVVASVGGHLDDDDRRRP